MEKFEKYLLEKKLTKKNEEIEDLILWKQSIDRTIKEKKEEANQIVKKLLGVNYEKKN